MMKVMINGVCYVPKHTYTKSPSATLADILRQLRGNSIDSLEQVAQEVGISKTYLHELETGKAVSPSFSVMIKLAKHYHASLDELANIIDWSKEV